MTSSNTDIKAYPSVQEIASTCPAHLQFSDFEEAFALKGMGRYRFFDQHSINFDEASAIMRFYGKTQEDADEMFKECSYFDISEDIHNLAEPAFRYYLPPIMRSFKKPHEHIAEVYENVEELSWFIRHFDKSPSMEFLELINWGIEQLNALSAWRTKIKALKNAGDESTKFYSYNTDEEIRQLRKNLVSLRDLY